MPGSGFMPGAEVFDRHGARPERPRHAVARRIRAERIERIGIVDSEFTGEPGPADAWWPEFDRELRERGWVEGKNLIVERRYSPAIGTLARMMAELIALDVDVIFAVGAWAALAAKRRRIGYPSSSASDDPVGRGMVSQSRAAGTESHRALPAVRRNAGQESRIAEDRVPGV